MQDRLLTGITASGITVAAYGRSTSPRPQIVGQRNLVSHRGACVNIGNADGFSMTSVHLSGCSTGLALSAPPTNASDVVISDNFFADIKTPFLAYNPSSPNGPPRSYCRVANSITSPVRTTLR